MKPFRVKWFAIALLLVTFESGQGQNGTKSASQSDIIPSDPIEFLAQAAKVNGLASEDIRSWHVEATFQRIDTTGKTQETGAFEGFWKSAHEYKLSYASPSFTRTIWATPSGDFSTSNSKWPDDVEWAVRRSLFDVTLEPHDMRYFKAAWRDGADSNVRCIDILFVVAPPNFKREWSPSYCFNTSTLVLRYGSETFGRYQAIFNDIVAAHGTFIARDVELMHAGKPYFRLHVDRLEALPVQTDAIFRPDPKAIPIQRRLVLDTDMRYIQTTQMRGISRPMNRKFRTPQMLGQEVVVQVLVDKGGSVADARGRAGDSAVQFEAIIASGKWHFKPYLVDGEPTAFYTELEFY